MKNKHRQQHRNSLGSERGNVFLALFGAVAIVGSIGATATGIMKGPMKVMSDISGRAMTENQLMANSKLAIMSMPQATTMDCDLDTMVEPLPYKAAGGVQAPSGGGLMPDEAAAIYATDHWGNAYGYCVWDHGTAVDDAGCGGAGQNRLPGRNATGSENYTVMAVISSGPDRVFQTTCQDWATADANADNDLEDVGDTPLVNKPQLSDDIVMSYTYAEAALATSSQWKVDTTGADPNVAKIEEDMVEVGGNSSLSGGLTTQGIKLASDPGDDSVSGACNTANDQALRLNTGGSSTVLEACDLGGSGNWEPVTGGGSTPPNCGTGPFSHVATYDTPGQAFGVWGDGTYIYVADVNGGIRAYTFDGTSFTEKGSYNTPNDAYEVWGDGTYIYVADDNISGLRVYNFDGTTFTELAGSGTSSRTYDVWGDGTYIYIADYLTGVRAFTFDGATLTEVGVFDTSGGAYGVWADDTYVYVADYADGVKAYTFDGTTFTEVGVFNTSGQARKVWGDGTYIYVADSNAGVKAYSFNGTTFTELATDNTSGSAYDVWGNGRYIFVADNTGGVIAYTFDGTTFSEEDTENTIATSSYNLWSDSEYLYVADNANGLHAFSGFGCATVIPNTGNDIGFDPDAANCQQSNSGPFVEVTSYDTAGTVYSVWGDGTYIYISDDTEGIKAFTFDGSTLTLAGSLNTPGNSHILMGRGGYIFIADGGGGIRAYTFDGTTFNLEANIASTFAYSVWSDGTYYYAADDTGGIHVYDFDGTTFTTLDTVDTPDFAQDVWGDGTYIYLANGNTGIYAFTFDGTTLTEVANIDTVGYAASIWGDGEYIYVGDVAGGVLAYVFDGVNFTRVGRYDTSAAVWGVWGNGVHIFAGDSTNGIEALTFDGGTFTSVDVFDTPDFAQAAWSDGTYVYLADEDSGLRIYSGFECTVAGAYGTGTAYEQDFTTNQLFSQPGEELGTAESHGTSILLRSNNYADEAGIAFDVDTTLGDDEVPAASITGVRAGLNGEGGLNFKVQDDNGDLTSQMYIDSEGDLGLDTYAPYNVTGDIQINDLLSSNSEFFDPDIGNCIVNRGGPFAEVTSMITPGQDQHVWSDGNYLYSADNNSGISVHSFDGSTTTQLDTIDTPGSGVRIWGDGTYVYLADYTSNTLRAYSFDGTTLTEITTYTTTSIVSDVWGDGTYIYVAAQNAGLRAVTFNGTTFTEVGSITTMSDKPLGVWGNGGYIYSANRHGGLSILTFDGSSFTEVDNITYSVANHVWGDGQYVYTASGTEGVKAFSFDGVTLTELATYDTPGQGYGVWADGVYVYVADNTGGAHVLSFDGTDFTLVATFTAGGFTVNNIWGDGTYIYAPGFNSNAKILSGYDCLAVSGWHGPTKGLLVNGKADALLDPFLTQDNPTPVADEEFAYSVDISGDYAVISTPKDGDIYDPFEGSVYVVDVNTGAILRRITNPYPDYDYFGWNVTIDDDLIGVSATYANVGATADTGRVYIFDRDTGALITEIDNPNPANGDEFGFDIDISGDLIVVGSPYDDTTKTQQGKVYVFNARTGVLVSTLNHPPDNANVYFGVSVAIDGGIVVAGADGKNVSGDTDAGAAYSFNAITGANLVSINHPESEDDAWFGNGIDVNGDMMLVAARLQDSATYTDEGVVYVFNVNTGDQIRKFNHPNPNDDDMYFGIGVSLYGDYAVIGAHGTDVGATDSVGVSYVFSVESGELITTINNPNPGANDYFGARSAIDGSTIIIGAPFDSPGAVSDAGAAFIYALPETISFFGMEGEGDSSANILYSNKLKIQDTNQDGTTITDVLTLDALGKATFTQQDMEIIDEASAFNFLTWSDDTTDYDSINFNRYRGTFVAPTIPQDGDIIGGLAWSGYDGTGISDNANVAIYAKVNGLTSTTNIPIDLHFSTDTAGNAYGSSDMVFTQGGYLGFKIDDPVELVHASERITFDEGYRTGNDEICRTSKDIGVLRFTGSVFEYCSTSKNWTNLVDGTVDKTNTEDFDPAGANCTLSAGGPLVEAGLYNTPSVAEGVWGDGTYIYVADGNSGLRAYSFDGSTFTEEGSYNTPGYAYGVWGDGTYIYVADGNSGLRAYSFDGSTFTELDDYNTTGSSTNVREYKGRIYLSDENGGLLAFTFDGTTLTLENSVDPGQVWSSWIDDDYVYAASTSGGLNVYSYDSSTGFTLIDNDFVAGDDFYHIWGDGEYIYVADDAKDAIAFSFDGTTLTRIDTYDLNSGFATFIWSDGVYVYTSNYDGGVAVLEFDGSSFTEVDNIDTSGLAWGVWGDGTYLYVADDTNGLIAYSGYRCLNALVPTKELVDWKSIDNTEEKISFTAGANGYDFGSAVIMSENIIVAGMSVPTGPGAIVGFNALTGIQIGPNDPVSNGFDDKFGKNLALAGGLFVATAEGDDDNGSNSGSAYVFDVTLGNEVRKLEPEDGSANDNFGISVAASENYTVIGANGDDENGSDSGSAYIFDVNSGFEIYKLLASDGGASDEFGTSVGMTNQYVIVGAPGDDDEGSGAGAVYIFDLEQQGAELSKVTASDGATTDEFGFSIHAHGQYFVVGAPGEDSDKGAAYVYNVSPDQYGNFTVTELLKLTGSDSVANDRFGYRVHVNGNFAAVSSEAHDSSKGAVYIFNLTTGEQIKKLMASDAAASDGFGESLFVDGNTLLVGAEQATGNTANSGAVYIYRGLWEDRHKSNNGCYPHAFHVDDIVGATANTITNSKRITLKSFAGECLLTIASESDYVDIIINGSNAQNRPFERVKAGDVIELQVRSSTTAGAKHSSIVTLGDQRATFSITTAP